MFMGILLVCIPGPEFSCDLFFKAFRSESECYADADEARFVIPPQYEVHTWCEDISGTLAEVE